MSLNWHSRFQQQAGWSRPLRTHLLEQIRLSPGARLLEVGCGTGAVMAETERLGELHGLDINDTHLGVASEQVPGARLTQADAHALPYRDGAFDLVYCHFLLLWVRDPAAALSEILRVTCPGGAVIAFAEPDYGGRIDFPGELELVGAMQRESLAQQGARSDIGRQLTTLFNRAGLQVIQGGILGAVWDPQSSQAEAAGEWEVVVEDYARLAANGAAPFTHAELESLHGIETRSRQDGIRVLFVPTFYVWGMK